MKHPTFAGEIEVLGIAGEYPPFIVSARVKPDGGRESIRYFTIDDKIQLPITEEAIVRAWILPRLT